MISGGWGYSKLKCSGCARLGKLRRQRECASIGCHGISARDEHEEVKEGQAVASEKMRVLPGTEKEIRKKRAVLRPAKNETIMMRGTNASAPDLVCGSCGAILAVGISSHNLRTAIACNRCDAVNETITKQHTDDAAS